MRRWGRPPLTSRLRRVLSRAFELVAHRRRDADLDEEIAAHLDLAAAEQRTRGLSAEEARAAAERSFGGVLRTKEAYRDGRGFALLDAFLQELRFAARGLRKSRTFTLVAVLTLALAIGANTAIFSVVYGALVKPLPYRDADRLVLIQGEYHWAGANRPVQAAFSRDTLRQWTSALQTIQDVAYYVNDVFALSGQNGSDLLHGYYVSSNFFRTLEGRLVAGRPFGPADSRTPVVVISRRLADRLAGEPQRAIGTDLTLNGHSFVVVGVADESLAFPGPDGDMWAPADYGATINPRVRRTNFFAFARLKPHVSLSRARADTTTAVLSHAVPELSVHVTRFRDGLVADARPALMILWATVGLVLLIACANLANLLLARNLARWHDTTVRVALGVSRGRLLSGQFLESVFLSGMGAGGAIGLAEVAMALVRRLAPEKLPWLAHANVSLPVLWFAAALSVATTLLVGVMPAFQVAAEVPSRQLGSVRSAPGGTRLRRWLSAAQLAAAVALLIGATLLGRSLVKLLHADIGVETGHVTTASLDLELAGRFPSDAHTEQAIARVLSAVRGIPGVSAAGVATALPPDSSRVMITLRRNGGSVDYTAAGVAATPGYFHALGLRLLHGRFFTDADDDSHPPVIMMGAATAHRLFGDADAIGQTISLPTVVDGRKGAAKEMTLVGIVSDVKYHGLAAPANDQVYRPFAQQAWPSTFLVVRTAGNLPDLPSTLRRAVSAVDPTIVLSSIRTLDQIISTDVAPSQFRTALLVSFAGLALLIAAVGLYGVIAYSVAQRTMEIGIRMALGARPEDVMRMVLREGAGLGLTGVAIGLAAAYGVTRLLASLLYGITATDPISFALAAAILILVALLASYLPARRAAHVDPLVALRTE